KSSAVIAAGKHLFPFRTEKLSLLAPMVLGGQPPGRVGSRRFSSCDRCQTSVWHRRTFVRPRKGLLLVCRQDHAARSFSRQSGSSSRSRRTRSPTGGC